MALPDNYDIKQYLPTEQDFANVFAAKQNGNYHNLPYYPLGKDAPYYYPTVRIYLAAILLKWEELGKKVEWSLLREKYEYINGVKTLTQYYTKQDLTTIRSIAIQYKQYYLNSYMKYSNIGQELESPEKLRQAARDARKGEIEVKIKGTGNLLRLIPYSMKYGDEDPNKRQAGAKMHLFFGKDIGGKYSIVIRGSNLYKSGKNVIDDAPYFATEQEARNFIANVDHNHINTKVTIEDWRYVITDKPIDNGYTRNEAGEYIKDWYSPKIDDAVLVQTDCGPAYMLKDCQLLHEDTCFNITMNMNESIEKHTELNQKIFDDKKLKPEVREKIKGIINEFLKILAEDEIKINIKDIILAGSNASYNYTKDSDIDLHIVANTKSFEETADIYAKLYRAYGRIFGNKFDISFYGIPVEIYVETEDNPAISNGIYSVMYDKWIKFPSAAAIPEIDQKAIDKAAKPWIDEAKALVKEVEDNTADGEEKIDAYITRLYELRQKGIYGTSGNEYSTENLIFKEVRNAGLLDKLKELKNTAISKKLSLEETIKNLELKKSIKEESYLAEKDRLNYIKLISHLTHIQPIIQPDGKFEIYNVKESDYKYIIKLLMQQSWVKDVNAIAGNFDFNNISYNGMPGRLYTVIGKIKVD